ncbi:probable cytochrome P450 6a13 [Nasonia vitripennis]|uniref:Cytochrome P450 n=1 Tax=Nasonia vitripennis TaxID=7425 RepID=A0A7M7Q623_NASVI|nr:probable cytochrome P450 6a13 [Nasonia vitripennis]XP_031780875.1 probable cytochrome P450 6a13 [Nasonia vitripennis]
MSGLFEVAAGLIALGLAVYYYLSSNLDFWSKLDVKGPKPVPLFGTTSDVLLGRLSLFQYAAREYGRFRDEPLVGIFSYRKPILLLRDPDLIRNVLVKDFSVFSCRGMKAATKAEPLAQHLVFLEPERWRPLRYKLSPAFTSGKLKEMFYLLKECAQHLDRLLEDCVARDPVIECRELAGKFTTDAIGVCAFGLDMHAIDGEDNEFRKTSRKMFSTSILNRIRIHLKITAPWLLDLLSPIFYDREMNDFFIDTVAQTMDYRKKNGVKRHDFIDLLMDIRDNPSKVNDIEITETLIASQAFVFFLAGFETSSTTISNALYEMALNPSIQDKLREEILEELKKHNGEMTYESIKGMKYLHKIFCETLRLYPPAGLLSRRSLEPYTFAGTKVTIPKNTSVVVPIFGIHHDPEIYPQPDKFDPERFDEEAVNHRHPSFYLPFGDGPRNCIGSRFGTYQAKVALVQILKSYKVEVCDQTVIPYVIDPKTVILLAPRGGIKLKFKKIK